MALCLCINHMVIGLFYLTRLCFEQAVAVISACGFLLLYSNVTGYLLTIRFEDCSSFFFFFLLIR
jgi:hypothetical protein